MNFFDFHKKVVTRKKFSTDKGKNEGVPRAPEA